MRKHISSSILLLLVLLSGAEILSAQSQRELREEAYTPYYLRHEIFLQYGAPTIIELTAKPRKGESLNSSQSEYKGSDYKYTGAAGAGYHYFINPYLSVGGYFGFSRAEMTVRESNTDRKLYTSKVASYTGTADLYWTFFRQGIWEISSGLGLGICYKNEERPEISDTAESSVHFAYNLTACKVRAGGTFGGFAEIGFGYRGLVNAGLSIRF